MDISAAATEVSATVMVKLFPDSVIPLRVAAAVSVTVAVTVPVERAAIVFKFATETPPVIVIASFPRPATVPAVPKA